jgi:hypothetical protein
MWNFDDLRGAAIAAIGPLASPVKKLVLARMYGFSDWLATAFADLFEREEDLTVEEAKQMAIEDVVTIAKGRREARPGRVQLRAKIE